MSAGDLIALVLIYGAGAAGVLIILFEFDWDL